MPDVTDSRKPSLLESLATRRTFLRRAAVAAAAVPAASTLLGACRSEAQEPPHEAAEHGAAAAAAPAAVDPRAKADAMDAMHEAVMKAFPAKTEGTGCLPLAPRMEHGVKVFDLTASRIQWEVQPGQRLEAWAYNGMVPGPEIRVREGDRVRINLTNRLDESTSIHFHGLMVPNDQDGVTYMTQKPVKPGDRYTYEFTVRNAGSHMYHSHHDSTKQVGLGLLGPFIVEPKAPRPEERYDVDYILVLNDGSHGYTFNGKSFPATAPFRAKRGQRVRFRFMNEGMMIHPLHLHGMPMQVIAKDGWPQPAPWLCDTLNVAPGERWDVIVHATEPGVWAFHCHILPHAESEHGMFGMVSALIVD